MGEDDTAKLRMPDALIADALTAMHEALAELSPTARTRELQSRADGYRRAFEHWRRVRPSEAQQDALRELVLELHEQVRELRSEIDMAQTPVVGVPILRTSDPPARRR